MVKYKSPSITFFNETNDLVESCSSLTAPIKAERNPNKSLANAILMTAKLYITLIFHLSILYNFPILILSKKALENIHKKLSFPSKVLFFYQLVYL